MTETRKAFDFVSDERTYTCRIDQLHRGATELWWWFEVSGDRNRYAPFRAGIDDTEESVRTGVLAYYEDRVARRAPMYSR